MSIADEVELLDELCQDYAQKLCRKFPDHELLRYYRQPRSDERWDDILKEFTSRFGKEGFQGDKCVGYHAQSYFYANFSVALKQACTDNGIST